jgi:hypothetical protein
MEFEENDGKTERKVIVFNFSNSDCTLLTISSCSFLGGKYIGNLLILANANFPCAADLIDS